jgi:hypothetical protein
MKKTIVVALTAGLLAGCVSRPVTQAEPPRYAQQSLVLDRDIHPMDRQEVIQAIKECESQKLRAVMVYAKRRINQQPAITVVDVTCSPNW